MYLAGHIRGAAFLDVDTDLAGPPGGVNGGRHPLPEPDAFVAAARRAGIGAATRVVAYDDGTGGAARLWWLLRHVGHDAAGVLRGGWRAWTGPVAAGDERIEPGDLVARPRTDDTVDADELVARLGDTALVVLDARAAPRYRGEVEPIDAVAGHIPGARNVPHPTALEAARALARAHGDLVAYCGSGVTATVLVHALAVEGRHDVRLYAGSWSEWTSRGLPAATGDDTAA